MSPKSLSVSSTVDLSSDGQKQDRLSPEALVVDVDQADSEPTNSLHGVSLLDQQLGSRDINVHTQCLLLLVDWLSWTCVFTCKHKRSSIKSNLHASFTTATTDVRPSLPHQHLSQTFGI